MKLKRNIIADIHASKINEYQAYQKLAEKYDYQLYSFLIYPPLAVCLQRNKNRQIPEVKYAISEQDIIKYWRNSVKLPGEEIFDSSALSSQEIADKILRSIRLKN